MLRFLKVLAKGAAVNALALLPAFPGAREAIHLPGAEWWLPWPLECLGALAAIDLSMTLVHVWWHGPLARLHATKCHHTIPEAEIDYAVGQVFGPWEPLMGVPTVWANIVLLGLPLGPTIFATTAMQMFALWAHTNWWPGWYRWLGYLLVTPVSHRVHHSPDPALYGKNCAFVFNWDRVLGTWIAPG